MTQLSERATHTRICTILQLVCQSWRKLVEEIPQLWMVMINAPLDLALSRSSNHPLDMEEYGYWNKGPREELVAERMRTIRLEASRIQELHLTTFSLINLAQLLAHSSLQPISFPSLRKLQLTKIELSRTQWCQIIAACPSLIRLTLLAIRGEFVGTPEPMELMEFSDQIFTTADLEYHQALHGGQVFGVQWAHIQRISLLITHAHHSITILHQYAIDWATVWQDRIRQSKTSPPLMTTTVEVYANKHSFPIPQKHPSSQVTMFCEEHDLYLNITTMASGTLGIVPWHWSYLPTLTHPPPGTLHLVIHPGHRNEMHSLQPNQ